MFPAQTSLIPAQIALVRFLVSNGWQAIFTNYPFWYLGTTPFRFLTGPVVPVLLATIHSAFPHVSLFSLMFFLIVVAWLSGGLGVYFLTKALAPEKKLVSWFPALFYLLGPIVPYQFPFSDGTHLIALSVLPWTLLAYLRFLKKQSPKNVILVVSLICFLMLTDTTVLAPLVLGMTAIFFSEVGWKKAEKKLKKTLWVAGAGLALATFWYMPTYWLTILTAPSFGGKPLVGVIFWLGKILPTMLALVVGILSVKFIKKKDKLTSFCFIWLVIFFSLSLLRFLSDPDFWLDWGIYGTEIQLGVGLGLALLLASRPKAIIVAGLGAWLVLFIFIFRRYALRTLQKGITQSVEYQIGRQLSGAVKPKETVFLSGSTSFWLNAFFDISQVRGGNDRVSVDRQWRQAAWEIREGQVPSKSLDWLERLKVRYLVVHTSVSREFWHDFKHPERFEDFPGLKKVDDTAGDRLYRLDL